MGYPADWHITSRCTLTCDFCYGPKPGVDPAEARPRIFHALMKSSADVITFCGGEPLMIKEIGHYATALQAAGKRTVLNTNGSLLRRRLCEGMRLSFNIVGLSLDGSTEAMHREMRGSRADYGAVRDAAEIIRASPHTSLKIATVISKVNQDDVPALADLVRDKIKPQIWRLYQYTETGPVNRGKERHRIPTSDFIRIAEAARAAADPVEVFPSTAELQGPGCLIISMDGRVYQAAPDKDIVYGNCLKTPLDRIWDKVSFPQTISDNKQWHSLLNS